MIKYFEQLRSKDDRYRLVIVGKGALRYQVEKSIHDSAFCANIKYIEKILNSEIRELYRLANCIVNLNRQEIFGMVLLEAMYYETKVVAWHAPGPDMIIENTISGYLVSTDSELLKAVQSSDEAIKMNAHNRVINHFTWDTTAKIILDTAQSTCKKNP